MTYSGFPLLVFSMLTLRGINSQLYQSSNGPLYDNNLDSNVRAGELIAERDIQAVQTPCRDKDKNKEHKDSLWWTLPIPPMELEGQPDMKPAVKQPQQVVMDNRQQSTGAETGAFSTSQQTNYHTSQQAQQQQVVSSSTAKAVVAVSQPVVAAAVPTTSGGRAPAPTAAPTAAPKDRTKIYQIQKPAQAAQQQQQPQQQQQQQQQVQPQQNLQAPPPSSMVISNKENNNPPYVANKSAAIGKISGNARVLQTSQHLGKPRVTVNRGEQQKVPLIDNNLDQSYYVNKPLFRSDLNNQGYMSDNSMPGDMFEEKLFNDNNIDMMRDFDNNEAEIGGGNFVGDSFGYSDQLHQLGNQFDQGVGPAQHKLVDPWAPMPNDERDKRNSDENEVIENIVIS